MIIVPTQPVPNQELRISLNGQECLISLRQKTQGLFFDLSVGGEQVVTSVIGRDIAPLVCREYAGFSGNFIFLDMTGDDDPNSRELGSRWLLIYLNSEEYELFSK
jgi:hypothetical protein